MEHLVSVTCLTVITCPTSLLWSPNSSTLSFYSYTPTHCGYLIPRLRHFLPLVYSQYWGCNSAHVWNYGPCSDVPLAVRSARRVTGSARGCLHQGSEQHRQHFDCHGASRRSASHTCLRVKSTVHNSVRTASVTFRSMHSGVASDGACCR